MGLLDLVEGAYEDNGRLWDKVWPVTLRYMGTATFEDLVDYLREEGQGCAEKAMFHAVTGDYAAARAIADSTLRLEGLLAEMQSWAAICKSLGFEPSWATLRGTCELAEEIDTFLAVLERQAPRGLVAGCRDDLDTLPILADWCEENSLPMAGREARRLHGLVRESR